MSVHADGEDRERVHGLVDSQPFAVRPVEHRGALPGEILGVEQGFEGDEGRKLADLNFCFSGTLQDLVRSKAQDRVRAMGGRVNNAVTQRTHYLLVGESPSASKIQQAKRYGIRIMLEKDFLALLKTC